MTDSTGTVVGGLDVATDGLNAATVAFNAVVTQLETLATQAQNNATTVINNFLARPGTQTWWIDAVNGNDAADGLTPTTPKKSIEPLLIAMQNTTTSFFLYSDIEFTQRIQISANLSFTGIAHASNSVGFVFQERKIKADISASNSPNPIIGTFCAGLWFDGGHLATSHIDVELQDVDPSYGNRSVFSTSSGASFLFGNMNLTVDSPNSGSGGGKATVFCLLALGLNAAGHIFAGVSSTDNPNNHFEYVSNLTSG